VSPTVAAVEDRGPLADAQTLHLDRGYDSATTRRACTDAGTDDIICARRRPHGAAMHKTTTPSGPRWPVERTNPWLSNFGQLRRNTDRRPQHRPAQLALAITPLIRAKPIDRRDRWDPTYPRTLQKDRRAQSPFSGKLSCSLNGTVTDAHPCYGAQSPFSGKLSCSCPGSAARPSSGT